MGTRADFYIGTNKQAEWLGSIALDGYPLGIDDGVLVASTENDFRAAVTEFLTGRRDATFVKDGWPWPWNTSNTTDYAYAFKDGVVVASCFGGALFDPKSQESEEEEEEVGESAERPSWPDMSAVSNFTLGPRSGLFVIGA